MYLSQSPPAGEDYDPDVIQFTIPPGSGDTVISVTIIDDRIAENPEQFFIGVLNFVREDPPGASLGRNTAVLNIVENEDSKFLSYFFYKEV